MKIVAIEEHVLPGDIKHAWQTLPGADDGTLELNPPIIDERLADLGEKRLAIMDETGVDMQVLSLTTPGLNNLGEAGIELAQRANDMMAQTMRNHPTRFQFLAALPFADADTASSELRSAVVKQGAKGGILYGRVGDKHLDNELFEATFACASELKVPLLIHPQIPQPAVRGAYYSGFTPAVDLALSTFSLGWHFEAGMEFVRMVLGGVFDRYPNLQVILGHWGEVVIFYLERLVMLDRVTKLNKPFIEYVRSNLYLTASGMFSQDYLQRAVAAVGADRILFSTDYPYQYRPGGDACRFVRELPLDAELKLKFAHQNWQRLCSDSGDWRSRSRR